jgi:ribosome-associated toxin RatA of RatAB toxin-antitoxin module
MRSTIAMEIEAPPDLVFRLARDVERWDRLLPHYVRSRAVERRADGSLVVAFVARRPIGSLGTLLGLGLPVTWRARTWADPDARRLRFVHLACATRGMDVTWRIEPTEAGSRVSIEHEFRPRLPFFAAFVDRLFTRAIAGRTLATFRALAEALAGETTAGHGSATHPSEPPRSTDPSA